MLEHLDKIDILIISVCLFMLLVNLHKPTSKFILCIYEKIVKFLLHILHIDD